MPSNSIHSRHVVQLWFARIGETTKNIELSTECLLSPTEKKRLASTKSTYKRREYLLSRAVLRHALSHHFPYKYDEWLFIEKPNSPPLISNLPENTHISMSHRKGIICLAIANLPVGIDIELMSEHRDYIELAKTFMSDEEMHNLMQNLKSQTDIFYQTWCAKEAYYKAIPTAEQPHISFKDISVPDIINNKGSWVLFEGRMENFIIAIVIKNNPQNICIWNFPRSDQINLLNPKLARVTGNNSIHPQYGLIYS